MMRLINVLSFETREFAGEPSDSSCPRYAILSHTWGREEVSFQDMQDLDHARQKEGFYKIKKCCEHARDDGLEWAWVDTCCIDKTSSAELSESINSMFRWYEAAVVCYVFLVDIASRREFQQYLDNTMPSEILWFTRGWTLQELIAPLRVPFFSKDWNPIGTKRLLSRTLSRCTGIPVPVLERQPLSSIPVLSRMNWVGGRSTTKKEDLAYCLLGIFNVNLPLLYGEGVEAFNRLQTEILRCTSDHTLFLGSLDSEETTLQSYRQRNLQRNYSVRINDHIDSDQGQMMAEPGSSRTTFIATPSQDILCNPPCLLETELQMTMPLFFVAPLEETDLPGFDNDMEKGVCVGAFSCRGPDGTSLVARYFVYQIPKIGSRGAMLLTPSSKYCFVSPDDVRGWDFREVTILFRSQRKQKPILEPLVVRRPGNETHSFVALKSTKLDLGLEPSQLDSRILTLHAYKISCEPTGEVFYLYVCITNGDGACHLYFEQVTQPGDHPASDIDSYGWVRSVAGTGPVIERSIKNRNGTGSAELVVSVFVSSSYNFRYYTPELRFRNIRVLFI